jgi:DNA-binding CsgD family transcriptional regulator
MIDEMSYVARIDERRSVHLSLGRYNNAPKYKKKELALLQSFSPLLRLLLVQHAKSVLKKINKKQSPPSNSLKEHIYNATFPNDVRITSREAEISSLIIKGYSTIAIGLRLYISPQTVKVHRRNIYRKLNISSQAELFKMFLNIQAKEKG